MAKPAQEKPRVVIVGAGCAGCKAAVVLGKSGQVSLTIIEPKDYFEVPYAAVRAIVDPGTAERSLIPFSAIPALSSATHIRDTVKEVHKEYVTLNSGQQVPYDFLILSTGATHVGAGVVTPSVNTLKERKQQFQDIASRIQKAKSIVVVGGGPVGVEIVGEIVEKYAGKGVTLIHSGTQLLDGKAKRMSDVLLAAMKQHQVKVLLNDRAEAETETDGARVLKTRSGVNVPAEVVVWATGSKPNTGAVTLGKDFASQVDASGHIKVDSTLRPVGVGHAFMIGDISDAPGGKLGYIATQQGALTAENILKLIKSGEGAKLTKWNPPLQPKGAMMVSFGRNGGTGHVGGCVCPVWAVRNLKSRDLFVGKARAELGA